MTDEATPMAGKVDKAKAIEDKIRAAYQAATDTDRGAVANLIKRATGAGRGSDTVTFTPGMAAIIFLDHNKQNREWSAVAATKNAEQMANGEWEWHNQGIGFLTSGSLGDGQHRMSGVALSGVSVEFQVTFGMQPPAIAVIDTGKRRQAYDYLDINHVEDAKMKQAVVKPAFSYLAGYYGKLGDLKTKREYVLDDNKAIIKAVQENDDLLRECIDIGRNSLKGLSSPRALTAKEAAILAFTLRKAAPHIWPSDEVLKYLVEFQVGQARDNERAPLFVASDVLSKDAQKRERVSTNCKISVAVRAFTLDKKGVKAVRTGDIRAAMKAGTFSDPSDINGGNAPIAA
jgi:hypothetical protein